MASQKIRIKLKAYDHVLLDLACAKIMLGQFRFQQTRKLLQSFVRHTNTKTAANNSNVEPTRE